MYKILLADDVRLTLASEKSYLEGRNLKVFATSSAREAREMAGVLQPDLVVLDYEMPDMTGADVCRALREDPLTAHIPVMILSIRDDEAVQQSCREAGVVGFIRKADGRDALLEGVARALGVPRRRHVRVGCDFTVGILEGGRTFSGTVENISESGIFLTAARRFDTGVALRLRFLLPPDGEEIRVLGEAVRSEELDTSRFGFGVQFLQIDPSSRQGLDRFLQHSL